MTTEARSGPGVVTPDILDGLPGVLISVLLLPDGRAREVVGLDPSLHHETGHFFASVTMVLDTLVGIWSDVVVLDAAPLRAWTARCGRYWLAGAGERAWVLDPDRVDMAAVFRRLQTL